MSVSNDISRRYWSQTHKAREEVERESIFIDDIIQKSHIKRELLSSLDGVETVFDGGAGAGRFSILLAKSGLSVTHFDLSKPMIEMAKAAAKEAGCFENMTFVEGSLEDLSAFSNRQFDLVLSIDAPISYTYPNQESVIAALIRIAKKRVLFSVSGLLGYMPYLFSPAQKAQYILDETTEDPFARWTLDVAAKEVDSFFPDIDKIEEYCAAHGIVDVEKMEETHKKGEAQWPLNYLFLPDELKQIMEQNGAHDVKLAGPGALSRSIPNAVLKNIFRDETLRQKFLDLCYRYDSNPYCAGMGKDNLVATAQV